jgi:hypothetical protein
MLRKILITEEENNEISNSYDDIDRKLMTFLLRRVEKKERQIGDDEYPLNVIEISFNGIPGYGFNSFSNRKDMERRIINMLEEEGVTNLGDYNPSTLDTDRQKIIKTIRQFLNFVMPKRQQ